jgi:RimJ/RimL family protein N-acetyltransferase
VIVLPFPPAGEQYGLTYCSLMERAQHTPPYRVVSERLVLRCYTPVDAPLLKDAVDSSLEHLRPWMPWAQEPASLDETIALLRRFRGRFDLDDEAIYGIFVPDGSEIVGGAGLHPRVAPGGLEIGYWIRSSRTGAGLATEAAAVLTRVAIELCGMDRVEIHVDPANAASLAIPRKLGYREEATLRRRLPPVDPSGSPRDDVIFSLLAEELPASPAARAAFEAFDAAGRRIH